jgi:tRNA A-37 threonylcarbamoyl transferase component Bud32
MPAPTNADELLDLLQKSNLVEEQRLRAYVEKMRAAGAVPTDPSKLAGYLVRDALLTFFQAEQLLQGKYKRFSLGKYKVLEKLGSGGMGTVFLCEHKLMRRRVAVKVLPVPKAEDRASLDRFYREARAVAAVDHPNIVRAYDIDQDDNLHFLVMEWVDGTNLQDLVKKFGPLDPVRACHYIYGAAVGLQHAHEIGLIHRDIKPGNILIDRSGVVKILDLGLARLTHDTDDQLTRQNDENVLGTADYLAPEQALDSHTVDIRADIYSLGATFYFLLTGSPPFPEGSVAQKLIWHQNRPPRPIKALRTDVPDTLIAVIEKMMAKDPQKRYQTPAEVMQALSGWVATPIPPPADRELPALSPAVAGGQGGNRTGLGSTGPATVAFGNGTGRAAPGQTTFTGMPTAIATAAPTQVPVTTPGPLSDPNGGPAVWESLDSETQTDARGDTQPPEPIEPEFADEEEHPSRVRRARSGGGKGKLLLFAFLGAVVFTGAVVGAYFAFFHKKDTDGGGQPPPSNSRKLTVSQAPGEHTYKSLREALLKATPGDTIVITEPRIAEPVLTLRADKHKDVTIESATPDGKPAVIEFAGAKGGVMFDVLNGTEGLRVRNVEFDGKGTAEHGVRINGITPGVTFEGVTVRNVQKSGFYLWNVAGTAERPVTLDRVRTVLGPTMEASVFLYASGEIANKFVAIKNSRFEGPGKSGIRFDGPAIDTTVTNNRFFNLTAAVWFARPSGRTQITNNTVRQAGHGLYFEVAGPPPPPAPPAPPPPPPQLGYELKVTQNYFSQTGSLLTCPIQIIGLAASENVHDGASAIGNLPPGTATQLDTPALPNPDPADDASFLRFQGNNFPTVGPNKVRVGAQ